MSMKQQQSLWTSEQEQDNYRTIRLIGTLKKAFLVRLSGRVADPPFISVGTAIFLLA